MIKNWVRALENNATEFGVQKLRVLQGRVPNSLEGVLFRNGPGLMYRSNERIKHWFDGDGGILGVHFRNGDIFAHYKYIRTEYFLEEQRRDRFIYGTYGSKPRAAIWNRIGKNMMKNPANTSVLPLENELLALYEGGWPYSLDPQTLETKKKDDLGFLRLDETFSAHPKVCPKTGEIYNFGITPGKDTYLKVYRMDKKANVIAVGSAKLSNFSPIHDCVLTEKYLIVLNYAADFSALGYLSGLKTIAESFYYKPSIGTTIHIFNRNNMSEACPPIKTDPFFAYHFTNGFEKKGEIEIEFVKHNTLELLDDINEAMAGKAVDKVKDSGYGELTRMTIDINNRSAKMRAVLKNNEEFPTVSDHLVAQEWRYSLFLMQNPKSKEKQHAFLRTAIGRFDHKKEKLEVFDYGEKKFPSEPILVSNNSDPENGYIITTVYDSSHHQSEVWVHHTKDLEGEPVCRARLPYVIPHGFHGRWSGNSRLLYGEIVRAAMIL